jgi:hypothetical protein
MKGVLSLVMKKTMLIVLATTGLTVGALAQGPGTILLANDFAPPYRVVATDTPGNPYTGTFGIEVWGLNAGSVPPGLNLAPSPGSGVTAYDAMRADGFVLQASFAGVRMSSGLFNLRVVMLPTIPGTEAVLALAVWDTSASSWEAMQVGADSDTRAGVIAFVNPVTMLTVNPGTPAELTGWTDDLVMTTIPEPSLVTVAALGGVLLLLVRRRRWSAGHTKDNLQHWLTKSDYEKSNT